MISEEISEIILVIALGQEDSQLLLKIIPEVIISLKTVEVGVKLSLLKVRQSRVLAKPKGL
jgi:hypothetical protein